MLWLCVGAVQLAYAETQGLRLAGWKDDTEPYRSLSQPANGGEKSLYEPAEPGTQSGASSTPEYTSDWRDQAWLMQQPGGHFTIQLMAGADRGRMRAYAEQARLPGPLLTAQVRGGDEPLYALLQGNYASVSEAANAAKALPVEKPWIRTFASVQKAVSSNAASAQGQKTPQSTKDIAWVWSRVPEHYTLQLKIAGSEKVLQQVLDNSALSAPLAIVAGRFDGKARYILIQGDYADYAQAQAALAGLPEALRQGKPWVRRYSSLHDELTQSSSTRP